MTAISRWAAIRPESKKEKYMRETHKYDDIINLPHHVSPRRSGMSVYDRAAQFSPFAALTGYEDVIAETGRLTDTKTELTDSAMEGIDYILRMLEKNSAVTVTYFAPDRCKAGGAYVTHTGQVKRVDSYEQVLLFTDGQAIPLEAIRHVQLL